MFNYRRQTVFQSSCDSWSEVSTWSDSETPWTGEIHLYVYRNVSREDWPMGQWPERKRSTLNMVGPSKGQTAQMMKVSIEKAALQPASLFLLQVIPPTAADAHWHRTDSSALQYWFIEYHNFPGNFQTSVLYWDNSGVLGNFILCLFSVQTAIGGLPSLYPIQ